MDMKLLGSKPKLLYQFEPKVGAEVIKRIKEYS